MPCGSRLTESGLTHRLLLHAALIHGGKVDGIQHQGREAAIARGFGEDLPGKGKEQAGAFDEDCRMQHLRGKVLEPEGSGIDQFSRKGDLVLRCSLGVKVKLYFEIRCRQRPGVDVDGDADLRLCVLAQRLRSVRVLET